MPSLGASTLGSMFEIGEFPPLDEAVRTSCSGCSARNRANTSSVPGSAGKDLFAYSIVSSAFYWPFAFADGDPAGYVHDSRDARTKDAFKLSGDLGTMHYRAWGFTQDDNFCRLEVDQATAELAVQAFDWDGGPIARSQKDGSRPSQPERLELAKWT